MFPLVGVDPLIEIAKALQVGVCIIKGCVKGVAWQRRSVPAGGRGPADGDRKGAAGWRGLRGGIRGWEHVVLQVCRALVALGCYAAGGRYPWPCLHAGCPLCTHPPQDAALSDEYFVSCKLYHPNPCGYVTAPCPAHTHTPCSAL